MAKSRPRIQRRQFEGQGHSSRTNAQNLRELSKHFLSAAEADVSPDATGAADHLRTSNAPMTSNDEPQSPSQPARRRENCAACAHLIARAGQPFQCRIFSIEYSRHKVECRERIDLSEGHTCPWFMRVTSKQIEDILRSHSSSLTQEQVREYAHCVDEELIHNKTVVFSERQGTSAEDAPREELLRYLVDGYSIIEATMIRRENASEANHSKTLTHRVRLRLKTEKKD